MKKLYTLLIIIFALINSLEAQNTRPVATDDTLEANSCETNQIYVLQNDYDPDGDKLYICKAYSLSYKGNIYIHNETPESYFDYTYMGFVTNDLVVDTVMYIIADTNLFFYSQVPERLDTAFAYITLINGHCYYEMDANNFKTGVKTGGLSFFWDHQSEPLTEIPKGSGKTTVFAAAPSIGGLDVNGDLHLAAERYLADGMDFQHGPICSDVSFYDAEYKSKWNKVWGVTKEEINYHKEHFSDADYKMPWAIANWPTHGNMELGQAEYLAEYFDSDANGQYNPESGDYPLILGDEAVLLIANDDMMHPATYADNIGVEAHFMFYAFNSAENGEFHNTMFMRIKLFNRSINTYTNSYFGMFGDFDIGSSNDDYIGCDVKHGAFYNYNKNAEDGDGSGNTYGAYPPTQAVMFLKGPLMDEDQIDNPAYEPETGNNCGFSMNGFGFGDDSVDNECLGLTNFIDPINNDAFQPDALAEAFYNFMQSRWSNGEEMEFLFDYNDGGGIQPHPINVPNYPCRFMYPANSDECNWGTNGIDPFAGGFIVPNPNTIFGNTWSEASLNNPSGNIFGDRTGVGSMGPFTFEAGSMKEIYLAFVYARSYNEEDTFSLIALDNRLDSLKMSFANNEGPNGSKLYGLVNEKGEKPTIEMKDAVKIYPNPARNSITIEKRTDEPEAFEIFDFMGRKIVAGVLNDKLTYYNISGLRNGTYVLKVYSNSGTYTSKLIVK